MAKLIILSEEAWKRMPLGTREQLATCARNREALEELAKDRFMVRVALTKNPNIRSYTLIDNLLEDPHSQVREAALEYMAEGRFFERIKAAKHPEISDELLKILLSDQNSKVRDAAQESIEKRK